MGNRPERQSSLATKLIRALTGPKKNQNKNNPDQTSGSADTGRMKAVRGEPRKPNREVEGITEILARSFWRGPQLALAWGTG